MRRVAEWTADALHRLYWIAPPSDLAPNGRRRWERAGESVTQWREDGRVHREFSRDGSSSARVSIDYPPDGGSEADAGALIRNPWCGYEARVVTLEAGPPATPGS